MQFNEHKKFQDAICSTFQRFPARKMVLSQSNSIIETTPAAAIMLLKKKRAGLLF